jgi:hypothetical protein
MNKLVNFASSILLSYVFFSGPTFAVIDAKALAHAIISNHTAASTDRNAQTTIYGGQDISHGKMMFEPKKIIQPVLLA